MVFVIGVHFEHHAFTIDIHHAKVMRAVRVIVRCESQQDPKVPSPNGAKFLTNVYWFALRKAALSIAVQAGAYWLGG
ncbi:MAG: hypothetical protein ACI92Z_003178 [Paracoccaceae bacterium]|jgi:hypothetical protein